MTMPARKRPATTRAQAMRATPARATATSARPCTMWYSTAVRQTSIISGATRPRSPCAPKAPSATAMNMMAPATRNSDIFAT